MKNLLYFIIAIAMVLMASCGGGGGGGGNIIPPPGDGSSTYPNMSGLYLFNWIVQDDPYNLVGRVLYEPETIEFLVNSSGSSINIIDEDGLEWNGRFTSTSGAFLIVATRSEWGSVLRTTVTGVYNESTDTASGTYDQLLVSGFGEDTGATVHGSWFAVKA